MSGSFAPSQILQKPGVTTTSGGVVAAQHALAARAGAEVLAEGGDAVDAAVAVSFAIGVLEPWMSGPAGGGAMMLWRADEEKAYALNYGMRASNTLDPADYPLSGAGQASDLFPWEAVVDDRNVRGATAVAVPGLVAGIDAAHRRFGRMGWGTLIAPAIGFAKAGMHVDWYAALQIAAVARDLARDKDAAALFLDEGTWPKGAGWTALSDIRLDQSPMAATLEQLAQAGAQDFYQGDLAGVLARDVTDKGGALCREDLETYAPEWGTPLEIPYRQGRVLAVPGLTAGPTLADALARWQGDYVAADATGAAAYVARARGLRAAYENRLETMGDHEAPQAPGSTTHFSIVDRAGNMVAMTQTLLSVFGARVVSPGTGLVLNNGIMWFDPVPERPNSLGPGKRCLMNVCPVIGETGATRFAVGASGGRKIMPAVAQIAARLIEGSGSIREAIGAPRLDASGGPVVIADERLDGTVLDALGAEFRTETAARLPFPLAFACPSGVMRAGVTNSGAVEPAQPWGDAVAEEDA